MDKFINIIIMIDLTLLCLGIIFAPFVLSLIFSIIDNNWWLMLINLTYVFMLPLNYIMGEEIIELWKDIIDEYKGN